MTNKITQLVNESGDNLYPLAGGMAADSIGTEMLKDGSVTSDKIDWTTMGNIGTKTFTVTLGGTAKQFTANRIDYGKVVIYCFDSKGDVDFSGATLIARTSLAVSNLVGSGETPVYGNIKAFQAGQTNTYIAYQRLTVAGGFDSYVVTNNTTTATFGFGLIVVAIKD